MLELREQPDVRRGKVRPPAIHGVVELAPQVFVVLPGHPRYRVRVIACGTRSVTRAAAFRVQRRSGVDILAASLPRGSTRLELMNVGRDVRDRLRIAEMMIVREMLHAQVPAAIVSIVEELFLHHRHVLPADPRHLSIARPAAIGAVAGGAGLEVLSATIEVRDAAFDGGEFFLRGRDREHGSGSGER